MVRSLLLTFAMLLSAGAVLAQTVLQGKVTDDKGEGLIGATVKVLKGADIVRGTITDYDGNFRVSPLDPGTYDVEISYTGFKTQRVTDVKVISNQITFLDQVMATGIILDEAVITAFKVPLIEQDKTQGGQTLTSDQIKNLPTRSVNAIVATTAGVTSVDGGDVNIKGSRSNATNYYIDGIRVSGSMPPVQDIEQLQVVTGGLGAEYGDVTGGVISVITKGPASEYHGSVEAETSYGLDPYGWLLTTANLSGPLWRKKSEDGSTRTVVGFRLSGQFISQKDDDPPALPVYQVKGAGIDMAKFYSTDQAVADAERAKLLDPDNVLGRLQAHPIISQNGNYISAAENLTQDSVNALDYRPDEERQDIDVTAKLDFRLTDNIDFSVTGTYKDFQNQTTQDGWRLLNSRNNPTEYGNRYRGIARFRHRLGSNEPNNSAGAGSVAITNANYQLQFGFERAAGTTYDPRHEDRLFDYGYVGRFYYDYVPVTLPDSLANPVHVGYNISYEGFDNGYIGANGQVVLPNPDLIAYNINDANLNAQNGQFSGVYDDIWSGMHSNTGLVYNRYNKNETDIMTITASAGFDLKLGRSGTHSIQFGLLNEQRTLRNWTVLPERTNPQASLWSLARQSVDDGFNGLDTVVIGKYWDPFWSPIIGDSIDLYANKLITKEQAGDNKFYRKIRESLGVEPTANVNIDELRPDQLSLNMFSPRELTDQNLMGYYGYTYTGEKLTGDFTFNDFFTSRDEEDVRNFPVAPLRPLYQAAFIKDKFTFNKMIFSLGLRVERFDLNTKVMKDQYSLYQIMTAKDYYATVSAPPRPGNVGDDFSVYVQGPTDATPKAFRDGDTWYFADGTQANDGNLIFGGGVVTPYLFDTISGDEITDPRFNPDLSFEDYTPQVSWLPRLAFSFPISEDANFFAHYDILVQRPPSNWEVTPLNYFYFYVPGRTPTNNANLLPERVVDYEVGFQQRLNQNSALKFSAYYREMRDMIQRRTILYVPTIGRYDTYGNVDFGTVKGFTVQYDMRRIRNVEIRMAYTLQFADGTGSTADSQRGLTTRGNIRTLYPLDFDERHNLNAIIDYRFAEGSRYNGPRIGGKDILSNFGINLQATAVSGRPYTAKTTPTRFDGEGTQGAINGNRLPWRSTLDLRIDKSFNLAAQGKNPLNLNIYFRVSNLLDRKNVINVYPATGSPIDDGYLATAQGQSIVEGVEATGRNQDAYLASYSWVVRNPNNYTLPRRMYVGAVLEF
ncbi:MAG TPA: carboxypeptidase regulatory-like domain-containing protein [Saprospiraceae bacterium]|nr:carboxypeptidase regulatory-like domain-containing protein [Saprospiraceae bacterium]